VLDSVLREGKEGDGVLSWLKDIKCDFWGGVKSVNGIKEIVWGFGRF